MTPIEKILPEIVEGLLAIGPWPWQHFRHITRALEEGDISVYTRTYGQKSEAIEICKVARDSIINADFIAQSPIRLAQLVVALVEARAWGIANDNGVPNHSRALHDLHIPEGSYNELKERLDEKT